MQWLRRTGALVAALTLTTTLGACGEDEKSPSGEPVAIEITVADGTIEPSGDRIEVGAGEPVDLVVTADVAGSIHIHSDPEQELAYEAGTTTFPIQIDRPGVVEVESHDPDQIIVQLEVR